MKKVLLIALVLLMAMSLLAACGGTDEPAADEPAAEARTSLTVGFDQNFAPYGFVDDNGDFAGFDLDLAAEVCARNGWELTLQPIDWDAKDAELGSGTIDCIWNGFTINGREDDYTWSKPYVDNSIVYVVKTDSGIDSVADLADKTITVQVDSSGQKALNAEEYAETLATFKEVVTCPEYNSAFLDLESGAVDAVALDIGVANFQILGREDQFKMLDEPISAEQYGIGFLLGNEELRDAVQTTLDEMVADGTVDTILEKYADYSINFILGQE